PIRATASMPKPSNTSRNRSRLRSTVIHARPDWNPSRQIFSNNRSASVTGRPHSVSWYAT
ncbi:MAG: hypothetical protein RJB57_478, partial [Actinomycetota bacterium]